MWWWGGSKASKKRAAKFFDEAQEQFRKGQLSEAAAKLEEVVRITKELAQGSPDDFSHEHTAASALYSVSAVYAASSRLDAAIDALSKSEALYRKLDRARYLDARLLVADVQIRRAGVMALQGRGASAVVEADEAVTTYCQSAEHKNAAFQRELARVLARNGPVLADFGDSDLAVGLCECSIRSYISSQPAAGRFAMRSDEASYLCQAAAQAALIHLSHGRKEGFAVALLASGFGVPAPLAGMISQVASSYEASRRFDPGDAAKMAEILNPILTGVRSVHADQCLSKVTLAGALAASGEDTDGALAGALTRPPLQCAIVTPSQRSAREVAPVLAERLCHIASKILPQLPEEGLRIGLEAHYIFAASPQPTLMRYEFNRFGPPWAQNLLACSRAFEARGGQPMALDLASWAAGAAQQLVPFAFTDDRMRKLVHDCFQRHGELLIKAGEKEGEEALAAAAMYHTAV